MAYTIVTGNTTYPTQYSYQSIELTADITLIWPASFGTSIAAAGYNEVTPTNDGFTITLPDATLASKGVDVIFSNVSIYEFVVKKNDGTILETVAPGVIVDLKLYDNSTPAGGWRIIPFLGGYNGLVSFTAESSNNSIVITNGDVTPPGAVIDFQLPESIQNLNNVSTTGFPVIQTDTPLTWTTRELVAGSNITITNPDGIDGNPVISLNESVSALTSLQVGDFNISGSVLTTVSPDSSLILETQGDNYLILNNVTIDTNGKMVVNNELEVTGSFLSPFTPKAWCTFTDVIVGESNDITLEAGANIASVTGSKGNYTITFTHPLNNINNYGVLISLGTTGSPLPFVSHGFWTVREASYVTISIVDASGELVLSVPSGATVMVMST